MISLLAPASSAGLMSAFGHDQQTWYLVGSGMIHCVLTNSCAVTAFMAMTRSKTDKLKAADAAQISKLRYGGCERGTHAAADSNGVAPSYVSFA